MVEIEVSIMKREALNRNALIDLMFSRAIKSARRYAQMLPDCFDRDDIECAALEGLVNAAERYDPALGFQFTTYAYSYIRGYIKRAATNQAMTLFRGAINRNEADAWLFPRLSMGSLDDLPISRLIESLKAERIPSPEQTVLQKEADELIWKAADQLPGRLRSRIIAYYRDGKTIEEIAIEHGRTRQAIASSLRSAHERLRQILTSPGAPQLVKVQAVRKRITEPDLALSDHALIRFCANEKCENSFVPVQPNHYYCSPKCNGAQKSRDFRRRARLRRTDSPAALAPAPERTGQK
jgi:RNA polymerase sigma factor (sigma-70 family)